MTTFIIPLGLIVLAAILYAVLRHRASHDEQHREPETPIPAPALSAAPEMWPWPTWPVTREHGDRQPQARRYQRGRS